MIDLSHYSSQHRAELETLLNSGRWQRVLDSGLVESVRSDRVRPGTPRPFVETVVDQLLDFNQDRVRESILRGDTNEENLFADLSR